MKPKRRAVPGIAQRRSPTVRVVKPAIRPVSRPSGTAAPSGGPGAGGRGSAGRPPAGASTRIELAASEPSLDALGGRPVALEVDLGGGLVLANPVIVASGPFGYGVEMADLVDIERLGGIVTRGTSLKARGGHPAPRMAEIPAGLLLGVGLQNPGIDAVLDRYGTAWARWPIPVILNLCGESTSELAEGARRLEGAPGVAAIELNLSCPNGPRGNAFGLDPQTASNAVAAVRRACDLPLIAKLTASAPDVRAVARACEDAGADAISAINTLPGLAVAADRRGPALGSGYGGISGPALRPIALRVVYEVAQAVTVPVIGIGGIATLEDVLDMLAVG
ncbi:MAG TPA: dihydroorotate dehydrogenase, partial [Candidatus Limnocylindrales bacterium]|nr:dihydroorotate dehydrogenase [Candidatus Limnocylindrales bacterium]